MRPDRCGARGGAAGPAARAVKTTRKDGGDDGGGCALIIATRFGPASRGRRAQTGAGLAAAPLAQRPGPGHRKGGSEDSGGGARICRILAVEFVCVKAVCNSGDGGRIFTAEFMILLVK